MALKTVDVPKGFESIFAQAEEVVSSYFAGLSRDPSQASIEIGGERYILVRAASLSIEFFALVRRLFGTGREDDADEFARNILFDLAHAIGKSDAESFHAKMDLKDPVARLSAGPIHFAHSGWASVKIFPESRPSPDNDYFLTYDHPHSFEADAWLRSGQTSAAPVCIMNAGYSSGWCEASFGIPLVAVETLCRVKGDPCCRFIMAPPETIAEHVERHFRGHAEHASQKALGNVPELFARKRLEGELRKSEERFRKMTATAQDAIIMMAPAGNISFWNAAAERTFGYAREEALGKNVHQLIVPAGYLPQVHKAFREFRQTGQGAAVGQTIEIEAIRKNGEVFPVELSLSALELEGEWHAIGIIRDITERKAAEEALRRKDEQLRHSQKMEAVGVLAGGTAHAFNNLLQVIKGYTEFVMDDFAPESRHHQDLKRVLEAADRAAALTGQLASFSRRKVLQRKNVDPNEVMASLLDTLGSIVGEDIHVELQAVENVGVAYADVEEIQQVLLNLCLNAREAMPSGGKLVLGTGSAILDKAFCDRHPESRQGRHVALSVTDTGCGIPPEAMEHIFEPFFTTKGVEEGAGLGLATVYGIVQQHGGAIHVDSEPGKGTCVTIYLPTVDAAEETDSGSRGETASGGTETILLAEDEPMVRDMAKRIFESAGYRVLAASDGEEALRMFQENRGDISLVVLDVMMPKLNGHEVYAQIKAADPDAKVVFCTAHDPETADSRSILENNLHLIPKPFDTKMLLRTVRDVLDEVEQFHAVEPVAQ